MIDFTAHPLFPDLLENQRRSVQYFLEKGILEELELFSYLASRPLGVRNPAPETILESRGQEASRYKSKLRKELAGRLRSSSASSKNGKGALAWWLRDSLLSSSRPTAKNRGNLGRGGFSNQSPAPASNNSALILHGSKFLFKKPQFSQIDAILYQKTYSAGLYIPVEIREAKQSLNFSSASIGYADAEQQPNFHNVSSTACREFSSLKDEGIQSHANTAVRPTSLPRWFYFGDIPLMTERGSFLINGAPRVLVNQIVRCPSVYFKLKLDEKNRRTYIASFLSDYGSWLRLETDRLRPRLWVRIDKSPRFPIELLLTSLGFSNSGGESKSQVHTSKVNLGSSVSQHPTGTPIAQSARVSTTHTSSATSSRVSKRLVTNAALGSGVAPFALDAAQHSIQLIWKKCNPGRWGSLVGCYSFFYNKFFNPRRYSLGRVGRLRLNKRLGRSPDCKLPTLTPEDVLLALDYLIDLQAGGGARAEAARSTTYASAGLRTNRKVSSTSRPVPHLDDIDHLKNRRVRLPGEIIQNQFRLALSRVLSPSAALGALTSRSASNTRPVAPPLYEKNSSGSVLRSIKQPLPRNGVSSSQAMVAGLGSIKPTEQQKLSLSNTVVAIDGGSDSSSSNLRTPGLASLLGGSPPSAFVSTLRELFNTSQLSQYMDQTNPLAEITHKRRLSSLGPGGVGRDQAGFAVREIHPSHFGRICPIETPEGQNAGLVGSLASYARINENGFLQSPLAAMPALSLATNLSKSSSVAELGSRCEAPSALVLRNFYLFPAEVEDEIYLCTADIGRAIESILYPEVAAEQKLSNERNTSWRAQGAREPRRFLQDPVPMRYKQEFITLQPNRIQFRGICPVQMISVATSLIPFLEHDDANRALMGSNMQRQAVPLMLPEKPLVGTGFELQAARDSSTLLLAPRSGYVTYLDSQQVELDINWLAAPKSHELECLDGCSAIEASSNPAPANQHKFVNLNFENYSRSNQSTCIRQRPAVQVGEWVEKGDLLADGSATQDGELALGKNILLAYVPWEGYNFEDALVINERLVYEDIYSSLHIERYELDVRNISPIQFRGNNQTGALDPCVPTGAEPQGKLIWPPTVGTEYITRDLAILRGIPQQGAGVARLGLVASQPELGSTAKPRLDNLRLDLDSFADQSETQSTVGSPILDKSSDSQSPESFSDIELQEPPSPVAATLYDQILQLDEDGIIKPGMWVNEGSILVGKLTAQVGTNGRKGGELVRRNANLGPASSTRGASGARASAARQGNSSSRGSATPEYRLLLAILGNEGTANYSSSRPTGQDGRNIGVGSRSSASLKQSFIRFQNTSLKAGIGVRGRVIECIVPWRARSRSGGNWGSEARVGNLPSTTKPEKIPSPSSTVSQPLQIFIAHKKRIQVGDKMSGRHGNKGILSLILPPQDMPYLQDGTPVDIILNPLGVPSRMNVGQVLETLFGLAAKYLGEIYRLIPFEPQSFDSSSYSMRSIQPQQDSREENSPRNSRDTGTNQTITRAETARSLVYSKLLEARRRTGQSWLFDPNNPGKMQVFDGRTGEVFHQPLLVGYSYMFKLIHLVDDKIHARSTGPYSLVTQQPLGGRSKKGGQRLGEMEVWACEGFGAAYLLQEFLTVKSDEIYSRNTFLLNLMKRSSRLQISGREAITSGDTIVGAVPPSASSSPSGKSYVPESFRVLVNELQSLCLSIYYNPDFRLSYPSLLGREGRLPGRSILN